MYTLLKAVIISLFISYWSITFFFTLPDNQLNLSYPEEAQLFKLVLFQKWGFFAPPPKHNHRVYLTFLDNGVKIKTFEIIEPIIDKKQQEAPFNWKENTIDYVINNSVASIQNIIVNANQIYNYELTENNKELELPALTRQMVQQSTPFKTLFNYSKVIAQRNGIDLQNHDLVLMITSKAIPKFHKRLTSDTQAEELLFQSDTLHYSALQQLTLNQN
jgi:hypothetical protein